MIFNERSYIGGEITDSEIVEKLPQTYWDLLQQQVNGCILFNGGLHIRGAAVSPSWHSLRVAVVGEPPCIACSPEIKQQDIPFGQDCFGAPVQRQREEQEIPGLMTCLIRSCERPNPREGDTTARESFWLFEGFEWVPVKRKRGDAVASEYESGGGSGSIVK